MRKFISVLGLLTWALLSTAQTEKTGEQIKKELAAHPSLDTFRVNRLTESQFALDIPRAERKTLAVEALAISRKIGYQRGEGFALASLGSLQILLGNKQEGDSLLSYAESFAKESNNQELIGFVAFRFGAKLASKGDSKCLDYFVKAEQALQKSGKDWLLANCQNTIAGFYTNNLSNYPLAMDYYLRAIHSAEQANSSSRLITSWRGLGGLYALLGDYDNALVWMKKAEAEMNKGTRKIDNYSALQNALGEVYRFSGKYAEAIYAYKQAIKFSDPLNVAINESNLADTYLRMDSPSLAYQYAFSSLPQIKQSADNSTLAWVYEILGRVYLRKAMPDSSIWFARAGLDSSIQSGTIEYMRDNAEVLANAYAFKKDFEKAYKYHLQFINYRDSMLNTEVKNKTALLQYNNDLSKKELQISQLNQQKKAQKNFLVSVFVILGLIIISAIGMLRNIGQKKKANKLLQNQKEQIDLKANELADQKEILQQAYSNVELLGEIGRKITSSLSVETIISTVYDNVNALMDASVFGIGIYHEDVHQIEFPATYEHGVALPAYSNSIDDKNRFASLCFETGNEIVIGNLHNEFENFLQQVPLPKQGKQPESLIYLPLKVKEKMFGVITIQSFQKNAYTDYHLYMLRTIAIYAAIALENAESYKKLNQTLESLKRTQTQLIQSEKMASLGELTAGIAHEIQNPLNFVNNFSDVNKELIEELKSELYKYNGERNKKLADDLLNDISQNLQKIHHHGRRADAIVKGMLQHSRTSSGQKELTDINALADEYLRLAYHGLRAKDKSFNVTMETDFDQSIGKINIAPQEIGRVILNLINNTFYAVDEKKKQRQNGYVPIVSLTTKKINDSVGITVKDNGNGIPQKNIEKIFQPFFTTKATGQGTGLGLSLSYDIIKAHGGQIKVNTVEGEYTEFVVELPA